MNTKERIISLIDESYPSDAAFERELGLPEKKVYDWRKGRSRSYMNIIPKIAKALGTTSEYLLCEVDAPIRRAIDNLNQIPVGEQCLIPVIGDVSAGAGVLAEEDILGYEIADIRYNSDEYFYLRIDGDSMAPKIDDNDLVLIHKQISVDNGDIGVFLVDGEQGFIKKVEYSKKHIYLMSINPAYDPIAFLGKDVQRVRVIGKAIEIKRKL